MDGSFTKAKNKFSYTTATSRKLKPIVSRINSPTQSKAWKKLGKLSKSFKKEEFRLVNLFNDSRRFSRFSVKHNNLTLDYSKNLLNEEALQILVELAEDMRLGEWVTAMFQGEKINTSEDRSALHTALRIPATVSYTHLTLPTTPYV